MSIKVNALEPSARNEEILRRAAQGGGERVYPAEPVYVTLTGAITRDANDPAASHLVCALGGSMPSRLASDLGITGTTPDSVASALPPLPQVSELTSNAPMFIDAQTPTLPTGKLKSITLGKGRPAGVDINGQPETTPIVATTETPVTVSTDTPILTT